MKITVYIESLFRSSKDLELLERKNTRLIRKQYQREYKILG